MKTKSFLHPHINSQETGARIRALRKKRGISVKQLQNLFNFESVQAIYNWEHGMTMPTLDNMVSLAYYLGAKIDDIVVTEIVENDAVEEVPYFLRLSA